jgi:hypothetical protein
LRDCFSEDDTKSIRLTFFLRDCFCEDDKNKSDSLEIVSVMTIRMTIFIKSLYEVPYDIDSHKSDSLDIVSVRTLTKFLMKTIRQEDSPNFLFERLFHITTFIKSLSEVPYAQI